MPLGLVLGLGLKSGLFELRYLVLSLPGLMLLAALAMARLLRHPIAVTAVALVAVVPAGLGLQQQYYDPTLARDDYRGLVAAIEREARPTDAVLLSAPNQVEIFGYYYHGPLAMIGLPAQRPIDPQDTLQRLDTIRAQYDRVWLVSWAMGEADPRGVISTWLAENGFQATHQWYGSVQLALVGFGPANASTEHINTPLDNGIVLEGYRLASRSLQAGRDARADAGVAGRPRADRGPLEGLHAPARRELEGRRPARCRAGRQPAADDVVAARRAHRRQLRHRRPRRPGRATTRWRSACTRAKHARFSMARATTWCWARFKP